MSPTKKKATAPKKTTAKKAASKPAPAAKSARASKSEKPAPARKAAAPAKPTTTSKKAKAPAKANEKKADKAAEKTTVKKAEARATTSKAAAKTAPAANAEAKTDAKATSKSAPAAKGKSTAGKKAAGDGTTSPAPAKRSKPRKPVTPTGPRHPKLGFRWSCYGCGAKFYDLGKEEPLCPKCGADQRDRPADEPRQNIPDPARPRVVRPMAQLLDDDEPVAPLAEDDLGIDDVVEAGDMFESDGDITHLELDPAELAEESIEASEPDEY
ncbi:MAG: FYDLN acid domain-containing protein [Myxococcota bacterium]